MPGRYRSYSASLACLLLLAGPLYAQRKTGDLGPKDRSLAFGYQFNTQGMGIDFTHLRRLGENRKWQLGGILALTSLVDLREQRIGSAYADQRGRPYVFDKVHWLYPLDLTLGVQRQLFRQTEFSRLSIHAGLFGGMSLLILRPYILDIAVPIPGTNSAFLRPERYDPSRHTFFDIYGESDFFSGFDQLWAKVGFKLQSYLLLNIADRTFNVKSLRIGVTAHFFDRPPPVMALARNSSVYVQGSLALMIGGGWNKREKGQPRRQQLFEPDYYEPDAPESPPQNPPMRPLPRVQPELMPVY